MTDLRQGIADLVCPACRHLLVKNFGFGQVEEYCSECHIEIAVKVRYSKNDSKHVLTNQGGYDKG